MIIPRNYRMNDLTAERGLEYLRATPTVDDAGTILGWSQVADGYIAARRKAASLYREAIAGCPWIKPQHVPDGWQHDYWAYTVALESADLWEPFTDAIVRHGGERPYGCWRITYQEPAFRHLAPDGTCPVAEDLQPRLVQGQTNSMASATRNADAWASAIRELGG